MNKMDRAILDELKTVSGNKKIRNKDIMEWSTSEEVVKKKLQEGEKYYHLPSLGIHVAVKLAE